MADDFLRAGDQVQTMGRLFDCQCEFALAAPLNAPGGLDLAAPLARDFWTWLGFGYVAIDIDGSPGSIPLDLNYDSAPRGHIGKYDLVTNYGTTEHVANQLNAFKVIHDMTALNGVMVHTLPAQGMQNHGLFNYNPKFFWMARSNGYKWLHESYFGAGPAGSYALPQNIVARLALFSPDAEVRVKTMGVSDAGLSIALQKKFDLPFVAPLDVQTGVSTNNATIAQRYWTVFTPNAFERPGPPATSWWQRVRKRAGKAL